MALSKGAMHGLNGNQTVTAAAMNHYGFTSLIRRCDDACANKALIQ
jgi:hypothetical protein